jgi:hypothetical protein
MLPTPFIAAPRREFPTSTNQTKKNRGGGIANFESGGVFSPNLSSLVLSR